jgi:AbiV family abortive infection protein
MTQDDFNNFSKEKLIEGLELSYENADNLFKAAQELSVKDGMVSFAISLIILSAEEALKTIAFLFKLFNYDKGDIIDVKSLFSSHLYKHDILETVFSTIVKNYDKNINLMIRLMEEIPLDESYKLNFNKTFKDEYQRRKKFLKSKNEILFWWENANNQKMEGFYLDYKNDKWIRPKDFK